jgi:two-component system, sporulation sensor kinase D
MKLYSNKQKWKIILLIIALLMVGASLFVSNEIVGKVAQRERERVTQWADAIKKRAELVKLTNNSFEQLRLKEQEEMELWIAATKEVSRATPLNRHVSYDLPLRIINRNNDIPVILLDQDSDVSGYINLGFDTLDVEPDGGRSRTKVFEDSLVRLTQKWKENTEPFTIEIYEGLFMTYYYTDSRDIIRLEQERDSLIHAFNAELIENPDLVPVLLLDSELQSVVATNLPDEMVENLKIHETIDQLKAQNDPIEIDFGQGELNYVFYANSPELKQLQYFPYIQFLIIGLFIIIGYIIFSTFRKAEQNQVWAGMAKETAHQLGTPISSLMAWTELLRGMDIDPSIIEEMNKDIDRLTKVTDRFSKIGAATSLEPSDIVETVRNILGYLKTRVSSKVEFRFESDKPSCEVLHNPPLIEWVVENICKNAIDAMEGEGKLDVAITSRPGRVDIDIKDSGKGMTASQVRSVFKPGFTTKRRGWGLGLTLAKRIIQEYHKGQITVLHSEPGKGTTFRITLKN